MNILNDFVNGEVAFAAISPSEAIFLNKLVKDLNLLKPSKEQETRHQETLKHAGYQNVYAVLDKKYIFTVPIVNEEFSIPIISFTEWSCFI